MQDTLSDMLVRIKNAQSAKKNDVTVVDSKLNRHICDVLIEEGFLEAYDVRAASNNKTSLNITLKYFSGNPVIQNLKRISKPSLRIYSRSRDIPRTVDGFGVMVVSTPKGVMSHIKAKQAKLGGELLFVIN
jgi:small subunit ribosomal protein S8